MKTSGADVGTVADHLEHERADRKRLASRALSFHQSFLDDALRGILPHDLVLIGAETGAGKTELAMSTAKSNARGGKRVWYLALEAEPVEIERRIKFALIVELALKARDPNASALNFSDWMFDRCGDVADAYDDEATLLARRCFSTLHTYYRGEKFGSNDVIRIFEAAKQGGAELIVLDHAHYIDIDDENENRGFKEVVKLIRDVALRVGIPVILVAHLRKRDQRAKRLVPHVEDFHGSSDLAKICTQIIQIAPAHDQMSDWTASPTYFAIPKDRRGGALRHVGLCQFDNRYRQYGATYTLGQLTDAGTKWEPLALTDTTPRWARRHRGQEVQR